jgi:hypothetical protein
MRLENWYVWGDRVEGIVTGHPEIEDGHNVRTSKVEDFGPNFIVTFSGHRYELGEPHSSITRQQGLEALERLRDGFSDDH